MQRIANIALLAFICPLLSWAQSTAPTGTPVQMVVTVGHHYGHVPPVLEQDHLIVIQRFEPLPITNLIPLRGDRADLELFVLVDQCSNCEPGSKFEELTRFIASQPATTKIGVGYIQNGRVQIAENPTVDHERAVQALSPPEGSKPASPFVALTELIRVWPKSAARHAVLMISNGINPAAKDQMQDPSAEAAIEAAQRAGVTVFGIYHPSADYVASDLSLLYAGQVQLAHVADETGGESYFLGFGPLPSLGPFLADVADHLSNQYLLEFLANPGEAPALQDIRVKSKTGDIELMAPGRVWVPAVRTELHRKAS